ncbi:DUF4184 family protein [Arsenicicoccus piscis]|uniref:DUF4184 family protein n=1 Tax=Arsenicicoccus piscis TaxID=673954 RepID=UPI001F4CB22A|nr:DUF4184 family protein [Arsenicicoccus piscis]MCH8629189.1 DUF4184 family protein [Arsenicicoccus piscis]
MPFTLAHPAAVLPLRRTGLPMLALVAGSVAPDLVLFVHVGVSYHQTHSLVGVLTWDVLIGVLLAAAWVWLLWGPLVDAAPGSLRDRLPHPHRTGPRWWLIAVPTFAIGAATHVLWDSFTHVDGWWVQRAQWLRDGTPPVYKLSQYASGAVGLAIIAVACWMLLRRRPVVPVARVLPRLAPWVWGAPLIAVGAATVLALREFAVQPTWPIEYRIYYLVVMTLSAAATALGEVALIWQVVRRVVRR